MFYYGIHTLTPKTAIGIANGTIKGSLNTQAIANIKASQTAVQTIVNSSKTVYGINTGFGILADTLIPQPDVKTLQYKILQSHSVGVGQAVPTNIAKLMLITKVHALAQGYSGIQLSTLERIIWHINNNVIPVVPQKGSVGASGDLAPLAHLFLPLIGLGTCTYNGKVYTTQQIFSLHNLQPITLAAKEGLALINGTQFILSYATLCVQRMHNCLQAADVIGAMTLEALTGTQAPFHHKLHALRPFKGAQLVAQRLRNILANSSIMDSHINCGRVQDPYSLRCMPQVHGASRTAWQHLNELTHIELNAITDNPVIFSVEEVISGGNFHGQPLAIPLDYASVAASELGNISDRRCYLLLEGKWGLPRLLMHNTGLNSGFMIPQYTTAALVTENKTLCFPASADSIPTSLGQEDHVSMGSISGRKLFKVLNNLEYILAIELLSAAQAIEFRKPLLSSPIIQEAHALLRQHVSFATEDRIFGDDIEICKKLIENFTFTNHIEAYLSSKNLNINSGFDPFNFT